MEFNEEMLLKEIKEYFDIIKLDKLANLLDKVIADDELYLSIHKLMEKKLKDLINE